MSRVWLITGADSGFGRAITEAAVSGGDIVAATARHVGALDDIAAAHPDQVEALALDVTDPAGIEMTVRDVIGRHGRIDVLVNNAGRSHVGAAEETTDAELRSLFEVHVFGPATLIRAVLPHMRARRSGAIVQLSSMGGQMSFAGFSAYSATKFALEGMSEALADEVRPLGIKVLIAEPGAFRSAGSRWNRILPPRPGAGYGQLEATARRAAGEEHPVSVFTVTLPNRCGELARLCEAMAGSGINLVLCATMREAGGIVVFVADDEAGAQAVLQDAGLQYATRPALTIRMDHQPGTGAATFRKLADAGVSTDLLLPVRISDNLFFAVICVDDPDKAASALGGQIVPGANLAS